MSIPASPPPDRQALSHIERRRRTELTDLADQIKKAKHSLDLLRIQRDSRLYYWHEEDGMSIELLASAAGITRQGAYDAIERFRKQRKDDDS
jgi:short-subunit dehydrogenase